MPKVRTLQINPLASFQNDSNHYFERYILLYLINEEKTTLLFCPQAKMLGSKQPVIDFFDGA